MFLLIDKPKGITSHDVVDRIREVTGERKVGHGGTLDPNATGLLIIGVGRDSTKKLGSISKDRKTYKAGIILGEERDSDDVEGKVQFSNLKVKSEISKDEILKILKSFIGEQMQKPPTYSAIKIKGKKAYELARKGKVVELKPRQITIYSIKLLAYRYPILEIETEVSGGTYIRALARALGKKLGCGAYLKELVRTRIGELDIDNSVDLNRLNKDNWKDFTLKY